MATHHLGLLHVHATVTDMADLAAMFRAGMELLAKTAPVVAAGGNERFIWRHQLIGKKVNPRSVSTHGFDPNGFRYQTRDFVVHGSAQKVNDSGERTFYLTGAEPVVGDLIIMVGGRPQTDEDVLNAVRVGYYRIESPPDTRRSPSGAIITCVVIARADYSGMWGEK